MSVHTISEPITLYGLTPHLHLRGKSMKYMLTLPDGREEMLLDVPKYDFNWQFYYELETPRQIPAGSKVTVVTLFDNSAEKQLQPGARKGSVLVRAELGRDVRAAGAHHGGQPRSAEVLDHARDRAEEAAITTRVTRDCLARLRTVQLERRS